MTTLQSTMTKGQAAELVEAAIAEDILSEVECGWKDHWNVILEDAEGELAQAIRVLTGKSEINETTGTEFDCNFKVSITITPNN